MGTNILFYLGIFTLAIFVIQTVILVAFGTDGDFDSGSFDSDVELDLDSDHGGGLDKIFGFLSIKNVINFLAIFSWSSYGLIKNGTPSIIALSVGIVLGLTFVFIMIFAYSQMSKLEADYSINLEDAVGLNGTVTLPIDEKPGKIRFVLNGKLFNENAVSLSGDPIKKNANIAISGIDNDTFIVYEV